MKKYFKLYKKEFILGPLFKLTEAILELLVPLVMVKIIDVGIRNSDVNYILKMGGLLLLISVTSLIFAVICQYYAAVAQQGVGTHMRNDMFEKIGKMSNLDINYFSPSTLTTRINNDVNQIQLAVAMLIRLVFRSPFLIAGSLVMAFALDAKMSIIFFVSAVIVSLVLYFILMKSLPMYKKIQGMLDGISKIVNENLSGIRVIRAFSKSKHEKAKFNKSNSDLTACSLRVAKISALLNPITFAIINLSIVAILFFGGKNVNSGFLSQGQIVAFTNYMTQILLSIIVFSNVIIIFSKAFASYSRVKEILDFEPTLSDENNSSFDLDFTKSAIEFKNVDFSFAKASEKVLSNISFKIEMGETVGIIGGTGSGKTALVNLIPRFFDVDSGEVLVFSKNVKAYKFDILRKAIHTVTQKSVLFSGSVRDNLLYGDKNATDEELISALKTAQAFAFVMSSPDGLDMKIAENGKNLSGGQKQRLTIARAIVGKPQILILDNSSSALDFVTEKALRKSISNDLFDTTVIIVSQRISSIKNADKIIVLDNGKICGIGTHSELLEKDEVYKEICLSQLSTSEVASK
ncbi:MAG: ABC transporter ATP-binding protein [Oscillospiraceae bacterium]